MSAKVKNDEIAIEFDGTGVSPRTLDPRSALELAAAYLDLLQAIASEAGREIQFTGLHVRDKCAAIATVTSSPSLTRQATLEAARYINGPDAAPSRIGERAKRVRRALGRLPESISTRVFVGTKWKRSLRVAADTDLGPRATSSTSLRATVLRVGGEEPMVRFESASEVRAFSLRVTKAIAKILAAHLYDDLDIVARVTRDADGHIDGGSLEEFHPVAEGSALQSWRDWHREHAAAWDSVDDLEQELGRDRS